MMSLFYFFEEFQLKSNAAYFGTADECPKSKLQIAISIQHQFITKTQLFIIDEAILTVFAYLGT